MEYGVQRVLSLRTERILNTAPSGKDYRPNYTSKLLGKTDTIAWLRSKTTLTVHFDLVIRQCTLFIDKGCSGRPSVSYNNPLLSRKFSHNYKAAYDFPPPPRLQKPWKGTGLLDPNQFEVLCFGALRRVWVEVGECRMQ